MHITDGKSAQGDCEDVRESSAGVLAWTDDKSKQRAKSAGGALALALLCHKGPFPIMVHITTTQAPLIARFLRQRKIFKTGG
ncbi:hypothetical protein F2Q68_00002134 [Brassica cretica]|uniref:DUF1279 domain-containing protein n=1 Tax=Brassica cretica TaxID=69181 RepID=A0A8S9J5V5_BRACR|nr:hypothetical protein F2Q68_00002134 [Brassica cretica]